MKEDADAEGKEEEEEEEEEEDDDVDEEVGEGVQTEGMYSYVSALSRRLNPCFRPEDMIGRVGSVVICEFAVYTMTD